LLQTIELKLLELFNRTAAYLKSERGQTTAEYVAVTAVAVTIALTVIFVTMRDSLDTAVTDIGNNITDFVNSPPAPPAPPAGP
jgi:Flp pilus assembly pilin Flp